jgi:hypothetical protein
MHLLALIGSGITDLADSQGDPETGRDVADWLGLQTPQQPVIIHASNTGAALGMEIELEDNGYSVQKETPYEDLLWVREVWISTVKSLLALRGR